MKKKFLLILFFQVSALFILSFNSNTDLKDKYRNVYFENLDELRFQLNSLLSRIEKSDLNSAADILLINEQIDIARNKLKSADFWLRYFQPVLYKKINGPLPVEWEFEMFDKPRKTEGAGLTLAELYLNEEDKDHIIEKDSLMNLIRSALKAAELFGKNVISDELNSYDHFFLCNRLFLLNLAAIYTTGFECPDTSKVIPELRTMLSDVEKIYSSFNEDFPGSALTNEYLSLYNNTVTFVNNGPYDFRNFDRFTFIRDYVNPLFKINQRLIRKYNVASRSNSDRTLNTGSESVFDKNLYRLQDTKGVFRDVKDESALSEILHTGKLLFYDPIVSGNNKRSCVSCHISSQYFTDTSVSASLQFDKTNPLARNTPSLINVIYNQLLMLDGKHVTLQLQAMDVIANPVELAGKKQELLDKILSCSEYKKSFTGFLKYIPQYKEVNTEQIVSAITFYYGQFSKFSSRFDDAMNDISSADEQVKNGFNLFMGKAQCGTCHFVPLFNGVKPPYVSSEFEVIGAPQDSAYSQISSDSGRYSLNRVKETLNAFRTPTVRNAEFTKPYMHNGVFFSLDQVIEFYNAGGGIGHGIRTDNQTLSSDSLNLSDEEKSDLISFIKSLSENITFEFPPDELPVSENDILNTLATL